MNNSLAKNCLSFFVGTLILASAPMAQAGVTLVDHDDWKITLSGFIETDVIRDSTRSLNEVIGNSPVDRGNSYNGDNGRIFFSNRNSRLAWSILPPVQDGWKSKGYLELDFLGYEPAVGTGSLSEAAFYSNPSIRIRHAYLSVDDGTWQLLAGQTWSLFGWQPNYVLTTVSVAPAPGILYQRTAQLLALHSVTGDHDDLLQTGFSIERPSQRDSQMPNIELGIRYALGSRRSGLTSATGETSNEPLSFALTGTLRQFETPQSTNSTGQNHVNGSGVALDTLIPLIASSADKDTSDTLTWTIEYSTGNGYADELPSWTGNLRQFPNGAGIANVLNLDAGQGGLDGNGNFALIQLQTWSTQFQFNFSKERRSFMTAGYSQVSAKNIDQLTGSAASGTLYNRSEMSYVNFFKDLTKQIRLGTEYAHVKTSYVDDQSPIDDRYQISAYFRF